MLINQILIGQEQQQTLYAEYMFNNTNNEEFSKVALYINPNVAYSEFISSYQTNKEVQEDEYGNMNVKIPVKDTIGKQFYANGDRIIFRDHIYNNKKFEPVIVNEKTPPFNWELKPDTLTVKGYFCNTAKLNFRGRTYNVWYTTEIPTQFGPWKFFGLPGLIIKIETTDRTISFDLTMLKFIDNYEFEIPKLGKEISFQDYATYQEKVADDFVNKLKSKLPRGVEVNIDNNELNGIEKNFR